MPNGEQRIHNRLAVLRAERGMSRLDLAKALGVNYQTVGYLERGELVPVVAATYPLAQIAEAQRDFEAKRHVGKLVLMVPPVDPPRTFAL